MQDLVGTLKILAVLLLCSGVVALVATFFDGARTGKRAIMMFLAFGSVVAALQIFEASYAPVILALAAVAAFAAYRTRKRERT